jgi:hypothetical protein
MAETKYIIIGGTALLLLIGVIVACGIGGILMLGMNSELDKTEAAGVEFGKGTDQRGCQDEAIRRLRKAAKEQSISERHKVPLFLNGCFQTCRASAGFCLNAPKEDSFFTVRNWSQQECQKNGMGEDAACVSLFIDVSNACFGKIPRAH